MIAEPPKSLPNNLGMPCYACQKQLATHVCRYRIGELAVQVCLCPECMQMDTQRLLKNTIGIQDIGAHATLNYLIGNEKKPAEQGCSDGPAEVVF
jgi:hypothetical protein